MTSTIDGPSLEAECSQCAALCCVSLAFDKSDQFAIDKPAGVPCPKLEPRGKCSIHADLEADGFKGCTAYTCLGAGQRVTQELFDGRSWQDDASLLDPMMDAFRQMRKVHELLQLLDQAGRLPLSGEDRSSLDRLSAQIDPPLGWTRETLRQLETVRIEGEVMQFMRTLTGYASDLRGNK